MAAPPNQLVTGQIVTGTQVINTAGQVVMTTSGVVGGQIVGDSLVVTGHQTQTASLQPQPILQSQQILQPVTIQQQSPLAQQQAVLADTSLIANNSVTPTVLQTSQVINKVTPIPAPASSTEPAPPPVVQRNRLAELVREVDPTEQLDEEVEDAMLAIADDFIESCVNSACRLARHRGSRTLDVRDLHMYLERTWHMWIPGFGSEELRPYKRAPTTEAHKQRMALIRKAVKKY